MEYYASPRWSGEIADCSMPMTFDTYSNCAFGCIYCFSQFQRAIGTPKEDYLKKTNVKWVNVERVKKIFLEPDNYQFGDYIKARKTFQWGGLSDQFDGFERKHGITLELMKFFKEINYPISFSTKATWFLDDKRYTDLIRGQKNWHFKISIITLDEKKARIVEKGVPSPLKRIEALKKIADLDCGGATLRLRPFIIGVSSPSHTELIKLAGEAGAMSVSTEFFCYETRSKSIQKFRKDFDATCGYDIEAFYKKYSVGAGYLRLNRNVKRKYVDEMEKACKEAGMKFYVSDAHFKERCAGGSCCGLGEDWNYSRGQFTEALVLAKKNGKVTWGEIRDEVYAIHNKAFYQGAFGFNANSSERRAKFFDMTMGEYIRYLWNNPQMGQSPYTLFEGVLSPKGHDEEGNIIYYIDESRL